MKSKTREDNALGFYGYNKTSWGQRSKVIITNLLKTLQNPEFIQELRWKLEMIRGFEMGEVEY